MAAGDLQDASKCFHWGALEAGSPFCVVLELRISSFEQILMLGSGPLPPCYVPQVDPEPMVQALFELILLLNVDITFSVSSDPQSGHCAFLSPAFCNTSKTFSH